MNIFLSHSSTDKPLVEALSRLLVGVFGDSVHLARSTASVSEGGIEAGTSWLEWIRKEVNDSDLVIVVLTPRSLNRPWLLWEAGAATGVALAREQKTPIVPLLYSIANRDVPSPLRSLQTIDGKSGSRIADLIETIRRNGAKPMVAGDEIGRHTEQYLEAVQEVGIPGMHDLFISCPMSSVSKAEYDELKGTIVNLRDSLEADGRRVYSAALRVEGLDDMDQEDIAAEEDLKALKLSRHFMMIYPHPVATSCLLEAGYALIVGIPSIYFVRQISDLPYMLRGALETSPDVKQCRYKQAGDILNFCRKYPNRILKQD
jgi:hypothetical protein